MSDLLSSLDLKFLPDWLKESPAPNRYAGFEGDSSERRQEGRERFGRGQGGGGGACFRRQRSLLPFLRPVTPPAFS